MNWQEIRKIHRWLPELSGGWHEHKNGGGWVQDTAHADEAAYISALVSGDAQVYGKALVYGDALVYGEAQVSGEAQVYGNARVSGDARVYGNADIISIHPIGSRKSTLTICRNSEGNLLAFTGCFSGTLAEFADRVKITHGDSVHGQQYKAAIIFAKAFFKPIPRSET